MSLTVYLKRFKIIKSKAERVIRLEFRGQKKTSATILDHDELITVNQTFVWHITTPIDKGELLTITLVEKQRFVASRVVGKYRLGLQVVVDDGMIPITDSLVDDDNQPVPVLLGFKDETE
ncbi:unnamed protein product [Pieris macdunnoughi]|uniref:Uncharacterized protein n=1 Tax=Pieris macdunnoughi TaxID=345717 RepID=A0A821LA67_9NEOP|nr:unnamed protein product [Pieris macdunnoughi]